MQSEVVIDAMHEADLAEVLAIDEQEAFPWTLNLFQECLLHDYQCLVLRASHKILGFIITRSTPDEAEIINLVVDNTQRKKGYGKMLLQYVLDDAKQKQLKQIFLEVRESNKAALALYQKKGFTPVGVRKAYYPSHDGREDGLVLRLEF